MHLQTDVISTGTLFETGPISTLDMITGHSASYLQHHLKGDNGRLEDGLRRPQFVYLYSGRGDRIRVQSGKGREECH